MRFDKLNDWPTGIAQNHRGVKTMEFSCAGRTTVVIILLIGLTTGLNDAIAADSTDNSDGPIETVGDGGVAVHGNTYFADLDGNAPLILLFHQGGSNGRGEYGQLAPWLNEQGFRAIAWDARAGGDLYGATNRTQDSLPKDTPDHYCDAYDDLHAALAYVVNNQLAEKVIVWGSSYSGALVFRLAADYPDVIIGVFAYSPASGDPMENCRARQWVDRVTAPKIVFKPTTEMERESSIEQKVILTNAGTEYFIVENGIHGSSMLVDERTDHEMLKTRELVIKKLRQVLSAAGM